MFLISIEDKYIWNTPTKPALNPLESGNWFNHYKDSMNLNYKTLEKLRNLINEETSYKSGPELVRFFNDLGSADTYGQGFPSRWMYTDQKLSQLNGKPELDKCIRKLFAPIEYIGRYKELDAFIEDFNQFLAFDKWKVVRKNTEITFERADKVDIPITKQKEETKEEVFLNKIFENISLEKLGLDSRLTNTIESRFKEIESCLKHEASLSVIFLAGSSLEGILLGTASRYPREYNTARTAPKKDEKVRPFHEWTLSNLIDTTHELELLKEDVKRFSHALRDFRNYIHPLQQISTGFFPDKHTAEICWQVLRAAIFQLSTNSIKQTSTN